MKNSIIIIVALSLLELNSCTKKGTLDREHWTNKEAGTYLIKQIQTLTYKNNELISDATITGDNTQFVLSKTEGDGDAFPLEIYGTWKPSFLNVSSSAYAWCVENDDKRLTLGHFDPSIGFYADVTLTVDNMKNSIQVWTYIKSSTIGGIDNYIRQIITVERQ